MPNSQGFPFAFFIYWSAQIRVSAEILKKEDVGKGGVDVLKLDWPQLVPDAELEDRLKAVSDWQLSQDRRFISRTFQTRDFSEGWVFISPHFDMFWSLVLNHQCWVILLGCKVLSCPYCLGPDNMKVVPSFLKTLFPAVSRYQILQLSGAAGWGGRSSSREWFLFQSFSSLDYNSVMTSKVELFALVILPDIQDLPHLYIRPICVA